MSRVPALVLKVHHGSLGIARSLGRLGVPAYAFSTAPDAPAARSRYWRKRFAWDIEAETPARSVEFLLKLSRRYGPAVLYAVSDRSAAFVAEHAAALAGSYLFRAPSAPLVRALISKKEMLALARAHDIPTPDAAFPANREEALAFFARAAYPVVLKAIDGAALKARAGVTLLIARDAREARDAYDRLEDPAHPNLMLQEYIPGGEDSVWMFNGYFDAAGECRAAFTGRKIRQNPVYTGSTSLGVCLANAEVEALTRRFMKAIGYQGILDIGYRYDARDGRYKVLDVNPRIGSSFRLFVGAQGLDVARAAYFDLTGAPMPAAAPVEGRKWMVEDQDVESSVRYWRDGRLGLGGWLASLRGLREGAWFAADDLAPFGAMAPALLGGVLKGRLARLAARLR